MTPYELSFHNGGAKETLVRGSQGKIYWESFLRTVSVVAAVALMVLPCIFFLGIRVMHDLRKVPDQLQHFSVRSCECFCCSHHHRHPETGQDLPCDRVLVYKMLKKWYSDATGLGKDEAYLDRFDAAWIQLHHERKHSMTRLKTPPKTGLAHEFLFPATLNPKP